MLNRRCVLVVGVLLMGSTGLWAQATESSIEKQLRGLRDVPDAKRPAVTMQLAKDIRTLPPGLPKLKLADGLTHLVTEGDPGAETLQAVADALSQALSESPLPAKDDKPPMPYNDLAKLVRYEGVTTDLKDPLLAKASEALAANDADVEKADFTLKDLKNKPWTLSQLRGKIVLVNFWATWCPPCRKEMPDLEALSKQYREQGLVILAISDEEIDKVQPFIAKQGYTFPVLLDPGRKVNTAFHVEGIPKTFIFGRDGKLAAHAIDMRTKDQFIALLKQAGIR